ncbi:uncharacterized protein LOC130692134 isoform X2 [Daphnia carinata]|uniref:uncharacterized protein LOC130692134 isoform X2 n=1 Tax=Daphnia carinata TaxID=120202 RepID=UPI002868F95A|nr:uncharacterized protein LOC130692134 isoform X2 [Daphnia carinata]
MRLAFSLFIVFVTYVIADKETQTNDNQNVHKYHSRDMESLRQLMTMSFILPSRETVTETKIVVSTVSQQFTIPTRRTVMEMTTSTSTITCTKSVAVPCSIRQRPSRLPSRPMRPVAQSPSIISTITVDEDKKATEQEGFLSEAEIHDLLDEAFNANEQQFPNVSPSVVQEVEPTVLQELPSRGARVADPQLMLVYGRQPEDIESAFYDGPYNPVTLPFSRRYLKPAPPTNRRYVEPAGGLQRQFLQQFFTVTRRSTVFELAISTVTPTCSEPGRIPQCPVEKKKTIDKKNEQDKESS